MNKKIIEILEFFIIFYLFYKYFASDLENEFLVQI